MNFVIVGVSDIKFSKNKFYHTSFLQHSQQHEAGDSRDKLAPLWECHYPQRPTISTPPTTGSFGRLQNKDDPTRSQSLLQVRYTLQWQCWQLFFVKELTIPSTGEIHLELAFTTLSYFSPQPNLCGRCTKGRLEGDVIGKSICTQQLGHNITFFLQSDIFATDTFYQNVPTPPNIKSSDFQRPHSD